MRKKLSTRFMSAIFGMAACLLVACSVAAQEKGTPVIKTVQISPDGEMIVFQYCVAKTKRCGLGLFNRLTNQLIRIPNPPGRQLGQPSFSYDGKQLAASEFCVDGCTSGEEATSQIVTVELETLKVTQVTRGPGEAVKGGRAGIRMRPVFQPGSDNILFVVKRVNERGQIYSHGLCLANAKDHSEKILIDPEQGFRQGLYRPDFISSEEIIFVAMSPQNPELTQAVKQAYDDQIYISVPFRYRLGGTAELIPPYPELREGKLGDRKMQDLTPSFSKDGKRAAFIYLSSKVPDEMGVGFNFEIYVREEGKVRQATNLRGFLGWEHISYNGRYVIFGMDNKRGINFEFHILDIDTGQVTSTGLRDRVASDPAFRSE